MRNSIIAAAWACSCFAAGTAAGLTVPLTALAGTAFYVAPAGNDSNPGTDTLPFRTLNRAVTSLKPGDILYVKPGVYPESIYNAIPSGLDENNRITVRAQDPNNRPVLRPTSGTRVLQLEFSRNEPLHHVTIDGLVIDATNITADAVKVTTGAHHITLANSEVRGAPSNGILLSGSGTGYNVFSNLDVHHNGDQQSGHGLYVSASNNVIENCRVHENAAWGIHVYADAGGITSNVVRSNFVWGNGRVVTRGVGIGLYSGSGHLAYNNVVWRNNGGGIAVNYGASAAGVYHNTLYGNGTGPGILIGQESYGSRVINNAVTNHTSSGLYNLSSSSVEFRNNLVFANGGGNISDRTGTAINQGNVTADPVFLNAAAADFRVSTTGAAFKAGAALQEVRTDVTGAARPGSEPTIGAYEVAQVSPPPPAPAPAPAPTAPAPPTSGEKAPQPTSSGRVFSVSPWGNDGGPGSPTQPFRTLNRAVSVLAPGDTLLVQPGTYTESLHNVIPSGTSSAVVTIKAAEPTNRPVIKPPTGAMHVIRLELAGSTPVHHVLLDGLILDGSAVSLDGVKITTGANNITLANCEIRNAPNNGILLTGAGTEFNTFRGVNVHHNGDRFEGHGIYISTSNNVVESSTIYSNAAWGVHVYADAGGIRNNVIRGNRVFGNGRVIARGVGIGLYSGYNHSAYNNVVWNNSGGGIAVNYGAQSTIVYHNTVANNGGEAGILAGTESAATQIVNNIVTDQKGVGILHLSAAGGSVIKTNVTFRVSQSLLDRVQSAAVSGNFVADPQFIDAYAGDLRLRSTSPAIDAGSVVGSLLTDIAGSPRTLGAAPDAGAFEIR